MTYASVYELNIVDDFTVFSIIYSKGSTGNYLRNNYWWKSYPALAAHICFGFLKWRILEGEVTGLDVTRFIREMFSEHKHMTCNANNASNNKTVEVEAALEETFDGKYCYVSAYCPRLKPIEKG